MKLKKIITLAFIGLTFLELPAQNAEKYESRISSQKGEKWWGGLVGLGAQMPYASNTPVYNLAVNNYNNQVVPLLLSSEGRYVWSEYPFAYKMQNDTLIIWSGYEVLQPVCAGRTLKDAYLTAATKHFPSTGTIPEDIFFSRPQYNTWIELMYNQNQKDILNYARQVIENGFPAGILMVDDNWQRYYGNFDFKAEKFENAKAMTDELHQMGFKVMLWIAPFISPDSPEFREMEGKGYLLKNKKDKQTAIIKWWNGYSACLDVTHPEAVKYFKDLLKKNQEKYGIDGFKFDAGDVAYMRGDYVFYDPKANTNVFSQRWAEVGLDFPYNEFRTTWKTGGQPLVQRLGDKAYSWNAAASLIPGMTTAGLLGFAYTCPDMIGGGQIGSFLNIQNGQFNEELIVRSCQVHALMPMMQFSVAPWRILSSENKDICARFARLHEQMGAYILDCAHQSSKTNEPIVRSMEYAYPHQGFIDCKDQFMLGDKYLVAPMITKGNKRTVHLPKGRWKDDQGKIFRGPKRMEIEVPIDRLPYYEKL